MNILAPLTQIPVIILIAVLAVSIVVVLNSAKYMIMAVEMYGKKFGLSDAFLGLFVVGTAVAMPAMLSSVNGLILNDAEIAIGSIIGANLLTIGLVVGFLGFKYKKLSLKSKVFSKTLLFVCGLIVLPLLLIIDGSLGRIDGIILLVLFFSYFSYVWLAEKTTGELKKNVPIKGYWKQVLTFAFALAALLLSTNWLVFSAAALSKIFEIPSFFTAVTVIAVGTSLPILIVRLKAGKEGYSELALGTYIGNLLVTFVFFFGMVGLLRPVALQPSKTITASAFMLLFVSILFIAQKKRASARIAGSVLILLYLIFIAIEALKGLGVF